MQIVAMLQCGRIGQDGYSDIYLQTKTFDGQTPLKEVFDWAEKRLDHHAESGRYWRVLHHRLEIAIDQSCLDEHGKIKGEREEEIDLDNLPF